MKCKRRYWQSEILVSMIEGMAEMYNLDYIHTNNWTISAGKRFLKHCTIKLLSCTIERNKNICTDDAVVIEGTSQETVDDPTRFNHQP